MKKNPVFMWVLAFRKHLKCEDLSQFTTTLIQTFALDEDEETEWYSEEKIRKMKEEKEREWEARKHLLENS